MCATSAKIIKETGTNYIFSKGYTSVENGSILPIIKLDLDTIMTKLNTNFHVNTCKKVNGNCWWTIILYALKNYTWIFYKYKSFWNCKLKLAILIKSTLKC